MSDVPSLIRHARSVLELIKTANTGPYDFILLDALSAKFQENHGSATDFQLGLAYGVGEGWFVFEDVTVRPTLKGLTLL